MLNGNIKLAYDSLKRAKFRSFLTMFGIIMGIASVVTTVSFGEGLKNQVVGQINRLGNDLITVRPGNVVKKDAQGKIIRYNFTSGFAASTLTENDLKTIKDTPRVQSAVPFSLITGSPQAQGNTFEDGLIVATNESLPVLLKQKITYGEFFSAQDSNKYKAVIGKNVAEQLFQEKAPVGKTIRIRNYDFVITGVFDTFKENTFLSGGDYNNGVFIPFNIGKQITSSSVQIFQILVKPRSPNDVQFVDSALEKAIMVNHAEQKDFTILKQSENLAAISFIINYITRFIAAIAAISIIVGGIGIMNIMLFTVSERTGEIGVRKSIGATTRQIRNQFMVEAILISLVGGFLGILVSVLINIGMRVLTDWQPVITLPIVGIATGVSLIAGIVFGTFPAVKAARLDPIEALRRG